MLTPGNHPAAKVKNAEEKAQLLLAGDGKLTQLSRHDLKIDTNFA